MAKMKFAGKLSIPEDIISGLPIITITGQQEVYVENYEGIIEYGENCIRVQTKTGCVQFYGKDMQILYYTNTDMKISGQLECVDYR